MKEQKNERQKVIAELKEWIAKEDNYHSKFDYGAQEVMHRVRQKLTELKGE